MSAVESTFLKRRITPTPTTKVPYIIVDNFHWILEESFGCFSWIVKEAHR